MTTAFEPPAGPPTTPTRRHRLWPRFLVAFVLGLVAVLGIGVGALYAYDQQYQGRILQGVHVGTLDLSGLTADEAAVRLHARYDVLAAGSAVLVAGGKDIPLPYSRVGRGPAIDTMVAQAMSVGRAGNAVERAIANARTAVRGIVIAPQVRYDQDALTRSINAVAAAQHVAPADALITRTKTGYAITPSITGQQANPATVLATLTTELASLDAPAELRVDLPLVDLEPTVTTDEANQAVAAADRIAADVRIIDGGDSWTISAATIRTWISFVPTGNGSMAPLVSTAKLDNALAPVAKAVARAPRNASFTMSGTRVIAVIPSVNGRALDRTATAAKLGELLAARATGGPTANIAAVLQVAAPVLTTAQAKAVAPKMREISRWETYFFITERNHFGANIWIPALDIDGTVVGPGETFDFWNAVGPVTRAHGYGDGGAIINGKTEPQGALAGGICSNSTTLFNAVLRAGFEMGARRNHFYYIDRYPIGLDATVFKSSSGSTQTMSWTNDTKYPVLIRGFKIRANGRGYVRYVLYSVPNGRKVVISTPIIKNVRPSSDTVVYTTSLAPGSAKRIEFPVDGKDVWRTVTVFQNGTVIHKTTYYSHYARITGVTMIGRSGSSPATTN